MKPRPTNVVWSVVAAALLLTAGGVAAYFAGASGARFMYDLERTEPALARVDPLIEPAPNEPLSRRVVVAIVDGLRFDRSHGLPYLDGLRARGVSGVAASQYPTWSRPNYVNLLTGVPPLASGVRTNLYPASVHLDSLMRRVREADGHAGFASDYDATPRLFLRPRSAEEGPALDDYLAMEEDTAEAVELALMADLRGDFDDARYAPWPGGFRDAAEQLLASEDNLVVLLIGVVDAAGHEYGGDSDEYVAATQRADQTLASVLAELDLAHDTVVVVADHGHTDRGGHGGLEPEVVQVPLILAGAGVDPQGTIPPGTRLQDVAPTVARLLGLPAPGHALGRTVVEALALDPEVRAEIERQDTIRIERNHAVVAAAIYRARAERLEKRALRIAALVVCVVVVVAAAIALRRVGGLRLDWRSLAIGVPAFFGVYYILLAVIGQRFSPSLLPARGDMATELVKIGAIAAVVQIGAGWWALRRKLTLADRLARANGIALIGLGIAMIPVALVWVVYPAPYVEVPGPRMLVLIPAVQVSVACYAIAIFLTLLLEVIVFFARAVDPRVRMLRLERALERARELAEAAERGELPAWRVRRALKAQARAQAARDAAEGRRSGAGAAGSAGPAPRDDVK